MKDEKYIKNINGAYGFDDKLAAAMKKLVEEESPASDFFRDFDASVPPASELFDAFGNAPGRGGSDAVEENADRENDKRGESARGAADTVDDAERRHLRRSKRIRWTVYSSLAAVVAIVVLVATVYTPGAFVGSPGGVEIQEMVAEDSAAGAHAAAEEGVTEVASAELPVPQAEYEDIYNALSENEDFGLEDMITYAKKNKEGTRVGDLARDGGGVETYTDSPVTDDAAPADTGGAEPAEAPADTGGAEPAEAPADTGGADAVEEQEQYTEAEENAESPGLPADVGDSETAPEYSDTNVQTEGVQEADIVKTDGTYIYTVNDQNVCITEAKDGHPEVLSEIPQPTGKGQVYFEMYIDGDTLTLVRQGYNLPKSKDGKKIKPTEDGVIDYPGDHYMIDTSVDIYDVSDRESPRKIGSLSQSGYYTDSRVIGDKLYLISTYNEFDYAVMDRKDPRTYVPLFAEGVSQLTAEPSDICLPPRIEFMSYTVVSGVDISAAKFVSRESLLGENYTVYASQANLYLSAMKYNYEETRERGFTVRVNGDYTSVTRLSLKDGEVKVEASSEVPGTVDDRFSLDEYKGALRIVTTNRNSVYAESAYRAGYGMGQWGTTYSEEYYDDEGVSEGASGSDNGTEDVTEKIKAIEDKYGKLEWDGTSYGYREEQSTGLYVLDMGLNILGKVDNLAPDEQVYSCRYLGDVAYFVTFRNTDPLFSVNLSDPKRPKVMGKLKIPGFSEYLHPYADGMLFGLGSDADATTGDVGALKVSMFDNSDPYDVKEKDKLIIDGFSYTYAADNPKAVLVDARKSIIAFPADGSYVILYYEKGEGFERVMDVNLNPVGYDDMWYWYGGLRGIFIGDVFYVTAPDSIHAYDMGDDFKAIDSVSLGSGAKYVDKDSFRLPPGYDYGDVGGGIPIEAYRGWSVNEE
ncbi:MAG: beta-propeller domain-containing protein [Clostridiales Family XIII bacterium]|jgi:uncharacterized secreted protein with C-terminal beta-propeller domain|nr:beta-propeller domain-containing protein [Clostridiales Family XIII bacterium]